MIANDPYAALERRLAPLSAVHRACQILNWDRSAMMRGASETVPISSPPWASSPTA
jgi:hypothetical protein